MSPQDFLTAAELATATAEQLRAQIREGRWTGHTSGLAHGYVQANLVILPAADAADFAEFCRLNDRACPLLEQTAPGDPHPHVTAPAADLRTDVPRYRVFREGIPDSDEPTDIRALWRDDFVSFLLGCSFTFEHALQRAQIPLRHVELQRNVSMYRTSLPCRPAGRFAGDLVVSMRPFAAHLVEQVIAISRRFPTMHGGPIHVGDAAALGIADLARPDFGEAVDLLPGDVPVFWACGVTPQLALCQARCTLAITHSPGCMFVTDWLDRDQQHDTNVAAPHGE